MRVDDPGSTDYWTPGPVVSSQVSHLSYPDQQQPIAYLLIPGPPEGFQVRPVFAQVQPPVPRRPGFG